MFSETPVLGASILAFTDLNSVYEHRWKEGCTCSILVCEVELNPRNFRIHEVYHRYDTYRHTRWKAQHKTRFSLSLLVYTSQELVELKWLASTFDSVRIKNGEVLCWRKAIIYIYVYSRTHRKSMKQNVPYIRFRRRCRQLFYFNRIHQLITDPTVTYSPRLPR